MDLGVDAGDFFLGVVEGPGVFAGEEHPGLPHADGAGCEIVVEIGVEVEGVGGGLGEVADLGRGGGEAFPGAGGNLITENETVPGDAFFAVELGGKADGLGMAEFDAGHFVFGAGVHGAEDGGGIGGGVDVGNAVLVAGDGDLRGELAGAGKAGEQGIGSGRRRLAGRGERDYHK